MFVADCPVNRPYRYSPVVLAEAANSLLNLLVSEQAVEKPDEGRRPLLLKEVESAIKYNDDGFDIGRSLHDAVWDINAATVELLDNAFHIKADALYKETSAWVEAHGIVPKHAVGDLVADKKGEIRTVEAIDMSRATYGITPPKASGKGPDVTYIVNYEELE